jgi:hypothetical protein
MSGSISEYFFGYFQPEGKKRYFPPEEKMFSSADLERLQPLRLGTGSDWSAIGRGVFAEGHSQGRQSGTIHPNKVAPQSADARRHFG